MLFPRYCVGCGREGSFICSSCLKSLSRITPPLCPQCGRHQASGLLCPQCVSWRAEIDGIRSPFQFDGVMRQAIHQLKYQNLRALVEPLAILLRGYFDNNYLPADTLVPVPLHPRRIRERGYNQAVLLARELGKLINLPVVEDCLTRRQHTPPQARTPTVEERRTNVSGRFYLPRAVATRQASAAHRRRCHLRSHPGCLCRHPESTGSDLRLGTGSCQRDLKRLTGVRRWSCRLLERM